MFLLFCWENMVYTLKYETVIAAKSIVDGGNDIEKPKKIHDFISTDFFIDIDRLRQWWCGG